MRRSVLGAIAISCWMLAGVPTAGSVEFAADLQTQVGNRIYRANLYCREDRWRIEHNNPGSVDVTIVRKDKHVMWLLLARVRRFKTLPLDVETGSACQPDLGQEITRDVIGKQMLDGHPTTFSQVTARAGAQEIVYYEWRADDMNLPLKVARKDGTWIAHYKNVRLRDLPGQMFELPLDYRPIGK